MADAGTTRLRRLESWTPRLFLLAGGLLVGYAALTGLWAFGDMATRQSGLQFGYVFGFLGLLGFYHTVADRHRWLARTGAVAAVSGIVGVTAITVIEVAQPAGILSETPPGWTVVLVLTLTGFIAGYLAFGVALLRTDDLSRRTGGLVLVPGLIVVVMLAHIAAGLASDVTAFVISAGEAMAHLAIGATLHATSTRPAKDARASEPEIDAPAHD